jgi:hypothetical protein
VLAPEVAAKQAAAAGHSAADELHLLTVHGALHLLGYDHAEPEEEREMFALQNRLLQSWRSGRRPAEPWTRHLLAAGRLGGPADVQLIISRCAGASGRLASMADAALATVSPARAAEMAREGSAARSALAAVASDVVRHLNLLLLLRLLCELTATTLIALVAVDSWGIGWRPRWSPRAR